MNDFGQKYPVCGDVPAPRGGTTWSALFHPYSVSRIPRTVLLDRKGTIAATGDLNAIRRPGAELAGKPLWEAAGDEYAAIHWSCFPPFP
jgi:hypothetical protein